jgi:hypothetical protein
LTGRPTERQKVVLIVIDGLTSSMFEDAVSTRRTPALAFLANHGEYRQAVSAFPSLTPVCLSTIATGAYPDVHRIPHLVWYHRGEKRVVEYGSSFAAVRRAGARRSIRDAILGMNQEHLGADAVTIFEALEEAGLTTAAVNITCYRGRTRHESTVPGMAAAYGPKRFFYYNLFESDVTGAPMAVGARSVGSIDRYAAVVGRWLVTRDGFDLLVYYLPDYDFASHVSGPDAAHEALERSDSAIDALMEAAGGRDEFLQRYAVLVCSDHGQTTVERIARFEDVLGQVEGTLTTASNRAAMVYRFDECRLDVDELARGFDGSPEVGVTLHLEGEDAVARRQGAELRFRPSTAGWTTAGDAAVLDHPNALERAWRALRNPNAGEILVSAAPGVEFADLGGRHHLGGGSHGSLDAGDSLVPMLSVGVGPPPESIAAVAPALLGQFGVEPPAYALARAA